MAKKKLSTVVELIEEGESLLAESAAVKADPKLQKGLEKLVEAMYLLEEETADGDEE